MKRFVLINILFAVLVSGLFSDDGMILADSIVLFGSESAPPASLDSRHGWIEITSIDWEKLDIAPAASGGSRKWRLHTTYDYSRSSSPTTVQVRLRSASSVPTFTHPWQEGADTDADVYSNWFEDKDSLLGIDGRFLLEARFITPPRTPVTGRLYAVTLEAWDLSGSDENSVESDGPEVQLAYARPLPMERISKRPDSRQNDDAEAAMNFALSFVEACVTGDLPDYYRSQADPVRSLDDGKAMARYRLNPPVGIPGITNIEDYKRRFNYKIYPSDTYGELFPEWYESSRPWVPGENAFLFMGHQDRLSSANSEGVDYLVFLVEADTEGDWKVVARPGD